MSVYWREIQDINRKMGTMNKTIRNDDVGYDSSVRELKEFCQICDGFDLEIIQGITLKGNLNMVCSSMNNEQIKRLADSNKWFYENKELLEFLKGRKDKIAVHGLWHTHCPTSDEIQESINVLKAVGLNPTHYVPPFNDGHYNAMVCGLELVQHCPTIEPFISTRTIPDESERIVYLHSRRFGNDMERLRNLLMRFAIGDNGYHVKLDRRSCPVRNHIVDFVERKISGKWLGVGCNIGLMLSEVPNGIGIEPSIDMVIEARKKNLNVYHGNAYRLPFIDKEFDIVVLSGVLSKCKDWQGALKEALRVGRKVIGYNPYPNKSEWGLIGGSNGWTKSVIEPSFFPHTEIIDSQHYYFEIQ